jgi:hypothetical protein
VLADWLAQETGVNTDEITPGLTYPALGSEGRCFGTLTAWYQDGELHGRVCAGGVRCGWDAVPPVCDADLGCGSLRRSSNMPCMSFVAPQPTSAPHPRRDESKSLGQGTSWMAAEEPSHHCGGFT